MLDKDTLRTCAEYFTVAQREELAEKRTQTYYILVLWGKLHTEVIWITEQETGGVLQTGERCTKMGDQVIEMLRTKHPKARAPTAASLDSYSDRTTELVLVDITDDMVTAVAGRLSGGAGPGGPDSVSLQHWLLRVRAVSGELRLIVCNFTEWLVNGRNP